MSAPANRPGVPVRQVASVLMHGAGGRVRHVAEVEADQRLVVLDVMPRGEPAVVAGPYTLTSAFELAEQIMAGSARHITHNKTPLVLAATLLALEATLTQVRREMAPPVDRAAGQQGAELQGAGHGR